MVAILLIGKRTASIFIADCWVKGLYRHSLAILLVYMEGALAFSIFFTTGILSSKASKKRREGGIKTLCVLLPRSTLEIELYHFN
jgi:hypothetical protein